MTSSFDLRSPMPVLRGLMLVVVASVTIAMAVLGCNVWLSSRAAVQPAEIDLAGQQRRLVERIAYDTELLRNDPGQPDVADELRSTVERLDAIRAGLLRGDRRLGLDGHVPESFRLLYTPAGLDLTRRIDRYGRAALTLATNPAEPTARAVIRGEAADGLLVGDLDSVVASLVRADDDTRGQQSELLLVTIAGLAVLGVAGVALASVGGRRARRHVERNAALSAQELHRERQLVASLRELELTRASFVSTVSHELRTPLTSITGYLELLSGEPLPPQQQQMVDATERNAHRLLALIEDLLTVSELEHRQQRTRPFADVGVATLIASLDETMRPIASRALVDLSCTANGTVGSVFGDRTQLERVLVNIVGNAIKFTPEGGSVTVTGKNLDDSIEISVSDTGIGVPHAEQAQLFSRFFRSEQARSAAIPGTGLGLAIAADLVARHGGTVRLVSEPGEGTTVVIDLPHSRESDRRSEAHEHEARALRP